MKDRYERKEREDEDDWGQDKDRRAKRIKNRKLHEKERGKEAPRVEEGRPGRRRNHIKWEGDEFDYQEEYGAD